MSMPNSISPLSSRCSAISSARCCRRKGRSCSNRDTPGTTSFAPSLRSEEHTSELQSLMRISYAVFCLKKKKINKHKTQRTCNTRTRYKILLNHNHKLHNNAQSHN